MTTVLNPRPCLQVSELQKDIVDAIETYAKESNHDTYDRLLKVGYFRLVLVRTLESGENMIMIQVNPSGLNEEKSRAQWYQKHILSMWKS